jgi:UDP-2,4-diacetamido-2,4,6-trideoxy-beta-L-altropyranose hydrolase
MNILFRCDGSFEIGMGHISRCLTLANYFSVENHSIYFAIRESKLAIDKVKKSYEVIKSNEKSFNYREWLSNCIESIKADLLIFDVRDEFDRVSLKKIKNEHKIKVITIDDPEDKRLEADFSFYPPVPQLKNIDTSQFSGKVFIGWEYVIVKNSFLKNYSKPNNSMITILITMGGSDSKDMTKFVIKSLNEIDMKFSVKLIVGPGYKFINRLNDELKKCSFHYDIFVDPKNIAEIMSSVDFAIVSFGVTAYELLAINIPSIYLCISDDHVESAKLFEELKVGISVGIFSNLTKHHLANIIIQLTNPSILRNMVHNSKLINMKNNNSKILSLIKGDL